MAKNRADAGPEDEHLKKVASALSRAAKSVKSGLAGATETAGGALPAASQFLARLVYTTTYTVSYGVVFPAMMIAKSIPENNSVVQGFVDGARAANQKVDHLKHRRVEASTSKPPSTPKPRSRKRKTTG
jgi:hypothetical protein